MEDLEDSERPDTRPKETGVPVAPAVPEAPEVAPEGRRRGRVRRTALLIAVAAVLGVIAGTCTGYVVQAGREPTPLPPLSQAVLPQATGPTPEALSPEQDRGVRTDGDLRKLLVDPPKGTREWEDAPGTDGWLDLADYAETFEIPEEAFSLLIDHEYRRGAVTSWESGEARTVTVRLLQFRQEEFLGALDSAEGGYYWAEQSPGARSWPLPGTGDGMVYLYDEPEAEAGFLPLYSAQAHAWRGDIAMEVWIYDIEPISQKEIMDLAKRQVARL